MQFLYGANGLLPHATLVCIMWTLVVMWVWYQSGTHSEDREWLNLKVGVWLPSLFYHVHQAFDL